MLKRELLILRHGKSDWGTNAARDFDRPLNKRGRKAVKRMGRWIQEQELLPDYIVSSPAKRAQETAVGVCRSAGIAEAQIGWNERIYGADSNTLLSALQACPPEAKRVMIIGHNPGLEELVVRLSSEKVEWPKEAPLMPTGAVARFEIIGDWDQLAAENARLVGITRPRQLGN